MEKILKNFFPASINFDEQLREICSKVYQKYKKLYFIYDIFLQVFPPRFFAKFIFFNNSYASHINREINNISISINLQHQRLPAISHFPSRKRSNAPNSPFQARQHISNSQNAIKKQRRK